MFWAVRIQPCGDPLTACPLISYSHVGTSPFFSGNRDNRIEIALGCLELRNSITPDEPTQRGRFDTESLGLPSHGPLFHGFQLDHGLVVVSRVPECSGLDEICPQQRKSKDQGQTEKSDTPPHGKSIGCFGGRLYRNCSP